MKFDLMMIDRTTYRIAAAIICITCLFYSSMIKKRNHIRHRLFMLLLVFTLIDCFTEPISYLFIYGPFPDVVKWIVSYCCQMIYYFTHFGIIPIYVFYIITTCGIEFKFRGYKRSALKVPFYVLELLLLSNPLTEIVFRIIGKYQYDRGVGVYMAYALSGAYFILGLYIFIRNWYAIGKMKRVAMIYFMALAFIGTFVQMLIPSVKCELLCEAIGLSGIMIMIEKDDDKTDATTGAYNRNAFVQEITAYFSLKREFKAICIRIENLKLYRKLYGYANIDKLTTQIADFLMKYGEERNVYHTSIDVFYMICTDVTDYDITNITNEIVERFKLPWESEADSIKLDVTVLVADCPQQLNCVNDIFLLDSTGLKGNEKRLLRGRDLDFLLRRIEVEKAIGRGISEKNFKLMFSPVYQKDDWRIKLAHVTLHLHDEELGEIPPAEFFDVAEGSGFIEELQYRTLEGVCRFLSYGVDKSDMQMDFVLVPIMSASILRSEFVEKVKGIVDHFKVEPSLIAFVMKESYALYAKETLLELMNGLVEYGIRIYISDYEAGFLGLNTIASYDLEGVILDIRSIFEAENVDAADIVFTNRINMIKQLGKEVIISGIDTKEYCDRINEVPVGYAEGEYLSPAITKNELQNKFWHGEHLLITENGVERFEEDESM